MELRQAVVHHINKTRDVGGGNIPSTTQLRTVLLPLNENLTNFVSTLRQLYNSKSGHGYGVFHEDQELYPFSARLTSHGQPEWDFLQFTRRAMVILKAKIDLEMFATGGYFLFADYIEGEETFLLVASLKNRPGYVFNENLDLTDQEHVDLDHLHEMARVNLTAWRGGRERYLSFAKRRTRGDEVTRYFRDFIGCDEFTESKTLTLNLIEALKAFSASDEAEPEVRLRRRQAVFDYCEEKRKAGEKVSLLGLSGRLSEDEPEAFLRFINEHPDFGVGDDFTPDRTMYRRLQRYGGGDSRLSVAFDADLLGNRVIYNAEQGTLLIQNLPANLRQQLDQV